MASISQQIVEAIQVISHKWTVFTNEDVAAYANLEGVEKDIRNALQRHCGNGDLLNLDSPSRKPVADSRYILKLRVEKWWVRQTLRWAESAQDYLTESQLANAMAVAFDDRRWEFPPSSFLEVGRRWAMVDDGSVSGTYVSPWAYLIRTHPQFEGLFRSVFDCRSEAFYLKNQLEETYRQEQWENTWDGGTTVGSDRSAIITAVDEALNSLRDREAEVIRGRFGLDNGHTTTLEELGSSLGVTRERIRQIEKKALKRLEGFRACYYGFAIHFIRSRGSLLIPEPEIMQHWKLLSKNIGLNTIAIPGLGLCVVGVAEEFTDYLSHLESDNAFSDFADGESEKPTIEELPFLPLQDAVRLRAEEREYRERSKKHYTRPRMAFQALRSLGRAAHFQEIAEECNRLFLERQCSTHNWHAALLLPESQELGVVWIGRKGIYGLVEQGYSRPTRDLFDAAASIVEARFADTGRPVPYDFVMRELSRERQDPDPASVNIALSINKRLVSVGSGRYMPIAHAPIKPIAATSGSYDFDAGFDAFRGDTKDA